VTPLYPQKLALTSPTGGGRSVGIVRLRTKATEYVLFTCFTVYTTEHTYMHFTDTTIADAMHFTYSMEQRPS